MLPSEIPSLSTYTPVRVFAGVWKLLSFLRLPSWDGSLSLPLLSLFLSFIFCATSFQREWAAFLGAWYALPAFRSCFVKFAQRSNVLSMNLWGRKWSPHPVPPPSSIVNHFLYSISICRNQSFGFDITFRCFFFFLMLKFYKAFQSQAILTASLWA